MPDSFIADFRQEGTEPSTLPHFDFLTSKSEIPTHVSCHDELSSMREALRPMPIPEFDNWGISAECSDPYDPSLHVR